MIAQSVKNLASPALPEPQICDGLQLPSGELGINFAAALGNYPEHGMKVWIAPWPGKALGDKVELLLNNRMIDQQVISEQSRSLNGQRYGCRQGLCNPGRTRWLIA